MPERGTQVHPPVSTIAWLDVSTADEWPVTVRNGPLGLQIAPLPDAHDSFYFRSGRIRGMRCIFSAGDVHGVELRRSARVQPNVGENTVQMLIKIEATGSVLDPHAHFNGGVLRVVGAGHDFSEEFASSSHICTLHVQQAVLGMDHEVIAAMTDRSYVVSPMQSGLLRGAVALLVEGDEPTLSRNVQAVDRYLASLATLLLRTAVPVEHAEPERLGSVRTRSEALIYEQAANPHLTPSSLATQLAVSLRQLYRAFDGTQSPAARIRQRRLELAAEILSSNASTMSVDKIAQQCGFVSAEYFSRAFRRQYGMSPRAYRSAHRDLVEGLGHNMHTKPIGALVSRGR